jgi:hypothetical protein
MDNLIFEVLEALFSKEGVINGFEMPKPMEAKPPSVLI